jgi:hypothetical protein
MTNVVVAWRNAICEVNVQATASTEAACRWTAKGSVQNPTAQSGTEALKLPWGRQGGSAKLTISPDGRWLVFVHVDQSVSELMMIENFR